jgi:hypothetical protein
MNIKLSKSEAGMVLPFLFGANGLQDDLKIRISQSPNRVFTPLNSTSNLSNIKIVGAVLAPSAPI